MQPERRQHIVLALFLIAAGIFLAVWGCPFLHMYGHEKLCIALYAVLLLVFIYGRANIPRSRRRPTA